MTSLAYYLQNTADFLLGFSLLGLVEILSVAFIIYYVYNKTRATEIIGSLFPNLHLNLTYRSSISIFNNVGNEIYTSIRGTSTENGYVKESKYDSSANQQHGAGTSNMLLVTPHAGRKPYNTIFDWGNYFPFLAQTFRIKKFSYPQVSGLVLKDLALQHAIKKAAEEVFKEKKQQQLANSKPNDCDRSSDDCRGPTTTQIPDESAAAEADDEEQTMYQKILRKQEQRAYSILMDMRSTINNFLLALTSWLMYKLLPCFLSGVVTHTQQIEMLKTASDKAPGIPLIFVPLHRSHLDYIMVTFILANNDIKSPLVAAGNNLQIPVFGWLLRGLGAFFIKRKIDPVLGKKDILYRAVLHLYLQHALKMGHNVEFFIEGGRTRTGKPCLPKNGILSVIVNAFMDGSIPDALLVPVSVNYERLVDGNFVREQTGQKKIPETFSKAISGIWKALNSKYGLMRIDFNEPYSIRELVLSYNKIAKEDGSMKIYQPNTRQLQHNQSSSSLYGTDVVCEEHRTLIDSISRQVVYDCAAATSVMTTNAVAHLLLTRFRNGGTEDAVAKELDKLRDILRGSRDIGFSGESLHIVRYACDLLGDSLVEKSIKDSHVFVKPKSSVASLIELSYYSNALAPHFALESIVMTALYELLRDKLVGSGVSMKRLVDTCLDHCDILRYEFILSKPTQNLENLVESAIGNLTNRELIKTVQSNELTQDTVESRRLAKYLEEEENLFNGDEEPFETEAEEVFLPTHTVPDQKSLMAVLAPVGHAYLSVAHSLKLLKKTSMLESEFVKHIIADITCRVENGSCPFGESISTDSVRNCLKLLEKWSVIELYSQHGLRLVSLNSLYESADSVQSIIQRIEATVPKGV